MAVVASELIAEISAVGAPEAEAQMVALSAASDTAAVSLASVEGASAAADVGESALAANMAELSAMTAEGAASADAASVSLAATGDAAASAIPSVADLDAQFAAMRARLVEVGIAADQEAVQMRIMASINTAATDAFNVAKDAAAAFVTVLGTVALVAGAVALVTGAVALKMAGDFQAGITSLETGAGELESNLGTVSQGILNIAVDTGTSTQQLIAGMFNLESAGYRGAAGLDVLRAAAEGARVGDTDLASVTAVLVTSLHDYHLSTSQAVDVTNSLITTVQNGVMHMSDLNAALTNVLSVASTLKVPLTDVEAALATMSVAGDKGAIAGTHLAMMFKMLASPASSAAKEMLAMGIDSVKLAETMRTSLPAALAMIQDAVAKHFVPGSVQYNRAIAAILGGSKSGIAGLELMGKNFKILEANALATAAALHNGSKDVQGWSKVQGDFNVQLARAGEVLQTGLIRLGIQLLPIITPLVKAFVDWATSASGLAGFLSQLGAAFTQVFGPAERTSTAVQHGHVAMTQLYKAVNPLVSIFQTLKDVMGFVSNVVAGAVAVWQRMQPTLSIIGGFLKSTFLPVWQQLVTVFQNELAPAWQRFITALGPAMPFLKQIGLLIGGVIVVALILFAKTLAFALTGAISFIGLLVNAVSFMAEGFLKGLALVNWVVQQIESFFKWLWRMLLGGSIIPDIVNGIIMWFTRLKTFLSVIVQYIVGWVVAQWTLLKERVIILMAALVVEIQAKLNQIRSFFLNIIGQAVAWGRNLINNFLAGLKSAWQAVVSWFTSALNWLKSLWPHSPVKEGPLKGSEMWGYNFIKNIADGMRGASPLMQSAMNDVLGPMGRSFNFSGSSYRFPGMSGAGSAGASPLPPIYLTVMLDGRSVAEGVGPYLAQQYITQNGIRQFM